MAGQNPILHRRLAAERRGTVPTFRAFTDDLLPEICKGFRDEKRQAQWSSTLKAYAASLDDVPVDEVMTSLVLKVLTPIWHSRAKTASRLRGRIEHILDAARAKGLIEPPGLAWSQILRRA